MIYLDYNASSPLRPEVKAALAQAQEIFGNPSSLHGAGREARSAIEQVRERLLEVLGNPGGELIFTSGGTEADNLALKGAAWSSSQNLGKNHLIISSVEHHAVLHAAQSLREEGFEVTTLPVDGQGEVDLKALEDAIIPRTALICVMHANNEVGTVQPIEAIAAFAQGNGILFHTDAVQSFGKLPLSVRKIGVDMVSMSSHKLGGPKGVGALYVRQGIHLRPLLHGGPHEHSLRAGTENLLGIVGMGVAVEATLRETQDGTLRRIQGLRDRLEAGLKEQVPNVVVNGHPTRRLPGTLNVSFLGCDGETLLMALDLNGICVSTGSACSSGSTEPSHVLVAMGLPDAQTQGSIRFSLGWGTTEEEIEGALRVIPEIVEQVRGQPQRGHPTSTRLSPLGTSPR